MSGILLRNATAIAWHPASVERIDLRIHGDEIVERGTGLTPRGEEIVDVEGRPVIPGMVCAHTHLYSALARGMPPPSSPPRDFREILEKIWWRLDRALDLEMVEASALVGALDAAACGTTTIIDHHASPTAIEGSLDRIRKGIDAVGLRAVLCYEVTDRGGADEARRGFDEHRRFKPDSRFRLAIGAHAAFTLKSETIEACGALARELATGVHVHVAEDPIDQSSIERLRPILGPRTILAHGTHLTPSEIEQASDCWFVHNPRSNMNNGVGYARHLPARTALGTDGIGADMFAEARFALFKAQDEHASSRILEMLQAGQDLAALYFGHPLADLAILDYDPPTPLSAENLAGHLVFGMDARHVSSVIVGGKFVVRDRKLPDVDLERIRAQAQRLWDKLR